MSDPVVSPPPMRTQLMDAAERAIRHRGYHGFSFRDLAADVGIRSASVHYHFPTKVDLVAAVASRYTDTFLATAAPEQPTDTDPQARLRHYLNAWAQAVLQHQMCLCGVLAAETDLLPPTVLEQVQHFFRRNQAWLASRLQEAGLVGSDDPAAADDLALWWLAQLEGAMLLGFNGQPRVMTLTIKRLLPSSES